MISRDIFDKRAAELYKSQYNLAGPKKVGKVSIPRTPLPFSRDQFALWLWQRVGLQAIPCPYCGAPIDILNCTIDHMTPRAQGGSLGLENLEVCCVYSNTLKGNMTAAGFRALMAAGATMSAADWGFLTKRILIGGEAQQLKWRNIRLQREQKQGKPLPAYRPPASLDFDKF